jgi:hypothetical protein
MLPAVEIQANRLIETVSMQHLNALNRRDHWEQTRNQILQEPGLPTSTVRTHLRLAINWLKGVSRKAHMKGATT